MTLALVPRWLTLFACGVLAGCGPFLDEMAERRSLYALAAEGPILIAVVDDRSDPQFLNGARLAVDQINASNNQLLGRPVELMVRTGSDHYSAVRATVEEIASDPRVSAVVGHRHPDVATSASVVYEQAKVLFLAPVVSRQLTWHGFDEVLRMLPNDETMTAQMASVASLFGYKTLALLHSHDDHRRQEAFMLVDAANRLGIEVAFRGAFFPTEKDQRLLLSELIGTEVDAVAVIADSDAVARVLRQLRELFIRTPVLVGYTPNLGLLAKQAGAAGDKTIVPVVFTVQDRRSGEGHFSNAYFSAYGCMPKQAAALGYDSILVFKTIVERAGTTEPRALVTTARYSGAIPGISGAYEFDANGDLDGRSFQFQGLRDGRWQDLPGVASPFRLARFQQAMQRKPPAVTDALVVTDAPAGGRAAAEQAAALRAADMTDPSSDQVALFPVRQSAPTDEAIGDGAMTSSAAGRPQSDLNALSSNGDYEAWFALGHELLGFKRLGLVVANKELGQIAGLGLARTMAKQLGFEVEVCDLPAEAQAEEADAQWLHRSVQQCYGRLARTIDALYVTGELGLSSSELKELNQALLTFGVASFAIGDVDAKALGLSLVVRATGLDLTEPSVQARFDGLLKGVTVREMSKIIAAVPALEVDIGAITQLGLRLPPRVLTLISDVIEESPIQSDKPFASEMP